MAFRFPVHKPAGRDVLNVSNCLAAAGRGKPGTGGWMLKAIADGIAAMPGIPGRMERV